MNKLIFTLIIGSVLGVGLVLALQHIRFQIPNPVATLPDGAIYSGDMIDGVIEGQRRMVWSNGDTYVGSFNGGLFHGRGRIVQVDGISYEGEFRRGAITGTGTMIYSDDDEYAGEFLYS